MANPNDKTNYTDPKTGKVVHSGQYIPDDHPDVEKRHSDRVKSREKMDKIISFIPFKSKKLKKAIKESKDKPIKKSTSKIMEERKINRKTKKMTETEGSFAKGGRAVYKGGKSVKKMGCAIKGKSPILR